MIRRVFKSLLWSLVALVLVVAAGLAWLLGTTPGLRWGLGQVPGLSVERAEGYLLGRVRLHGLGFRQDATEVDIERAELRWSPAQLLQRRVQLSRLELAGVNLRLPAPQAVAEPAPWPPQLPDFEALSRKIPFAVVVEHASVEGLRFEQVGSPPQALRRFELRAHTQGPVLFIDQLAVDAPLFDLNSGFDGSLDLRPPYTLKLVSQTRAASPDYGRLHTHLELSGDTTLMRLQAQVEVWPPQAAADAEPALDLGLDGNLRNLFGSLAWDTEVRLSRADTGGAWAAQFLGGRQIQADGVIKASGDTQQARVGADLNAKLPGYGEFKLQAQATGGRAGWQVQNLSLQRDGGPMRLALEGEVDLSQAEPQVDVRLLWQHLAWPLETTPAEFASAQGRLELSGGPSAYVLSLEADAGGTQIPASHWRVSADGTPQQLKLHDLRATLLEGELGLQGEVAWQPEPRWNLTLQGAGLNPGGYQTDWPGKLDLALDSEGSLRDAVLDAQVRVRKLEGKLRGYPLRLQGEVAVLGDHYRFKQVRLGSGSAELKLDGELAKQWKLDWSLELPALADVLPEARGRVSGSGQLRGALQQPQVKATLQANGLVWRQLRLRELSLDADTDLAPGGKIQFQLDAAGLEQDAFKLDSLRLEGDGSTESHRLRLRARLPQLDLSTELNGGWRPPRWQGELSQLKLEPAQFGTWQTPAAAALALSAERASLGQTCLRHSADPSAASGQDAGDRAELCLQFDWDNSGGSRIEAELKHLALALAHALLPPETELGGELSASLQAALGADGELRADTTIRLSPGHIASALNPDPATHFRHRGGELSARVGAEGAELHLDLGLQQDDGLQARVQLPGLHRLPLAEAQPLSGELHLRVADFGLLPLLFPEYLDALQARLQADLSLGGSLQAPQLQGKLSLSDGDLQVPVAGLHLREFKLDLQDRADGGLDLSAGLTSGKGRISLEGVLQPMSPWRVALKLKGEDFEAFNTPDAWVLLSPDLSLQTDADQVKLSGQVTVPRAEITPRQLGGGAVHSSADVVILGGDGENAEPALEPAPTLAFASEVRLLLGREVNIQAAGFNGRVEGNLLLSNRPGQIPLGSGEITVPEGTYKSYGQDLKVRRGRAIFSGSPLDNPGLDLEAVREVSNVVAGIRVSGTARKPELSLFSEPVMDQSDALSYLVLGRSMSDLTKGGGGGSLGEMQLLLSAASALSEGNVGAVRTVSRQLGLDEARLQVDETAAGQESASFVLGKYLNPRLYISYGIGLFDAVNTFTARYSIRPNLVLETEAGAGVGVDLKYTLER